ncbi:hypothetical protein F443_07738 [Phytophthora nicotianae P1569]|uniref:Ribosome assembly protein 3 n=1 Tax=Phytophthora nicotianae P1569 TaxID=1317065 RepID=V9FAN2_PHYNI|nr:hypothetical protein F443_07738 [Phytophthora nicotianae P1569]
MEDKAARLVARYDRLIAALGEDAFKASRGVCARVEDASAAVTGTENDEQRQRLLSEATDKCVRCAELIAKSLEATATLSKLQKTLKNAYSHSQNGHHDEDEDMESEEDEQDEATTLLLQDLVAAGDEAEDAAKKYARMGVVRKTAHASHELLASAEHDLQEHLSSESASAGDATVQNEFRQLYMEEFTTAFGDELDQFRQEERFESKDVTYLISCIHAGGDIFTPLQKKLFVESVEASRATE